MVWFSASEEGRVGSGTSGNPGTVTNDMLLRHKVRLPLPQLLIPCLLYADRFSFTLFLHECQPGFTNGGIADEAAASSCLAVFVRFGRRASPIRVCFFFSFFFMN